MNRKRVTQITDIPERRILFYTEQNVLPGFTKNVGRGRAREYTEMDVFYLMIAKELDKIGFSLTKIKVFIMSLHYHKLLKNVDIISEIKKSEKPVILSLYFPEGPEDHSLHPTSKYYNDEFTISQDIDIERSSQVILNLNKIFGKAKF